MQNHDKRKTCYMEGRKIIMTSWDIFKVILFGLCCYIVGRCDERDDSCLGFIIVAAGTMIVWFLWGDLF